MGSGKWGGWWGNSGEMVGRWIEVMLEAQLDELAQHRQHASVMVGDAALDQVHDVRVRLELTELRHEALQVHAVHGLERRLARLDLC